MSEVASGFRGHGRTEVARPEDLEPVAAHLDRVLDGLAPLEARTVRTEQAVGLSLAEDVVAPGPITPFASSAMDGYAVVAADVSGATADAPARLAVTGEVAAGAVGDAPLRPGEAVRIMTGAPVPEGADAVVPVELTTESDAEVAVHVAVEAGANIRPAGEIAAAGDVLLRTGRRVGPGELAVLATVGLTAVRCHPAPRVGIVTTGDEIVSAGRELARGQIHDSNGPMLAALVAAAGATAVRRGPVPDDPDALRATFTEVTDEVDLLITTGGVSAGAHDHVRDVLAELGDVRPTRVAMKPGMPQAAGRVRGVPAIGVPGNPVSAFVSFEVFALPAIRRLQGRADLHRPTVRAELGAPLRASPHKRTFIRVRLDERPDPWRATPTGHQGSHVLTSVADADGLAEIDEDTVDVPAGETVTVRLLTDLR